MMRSRQFQICSAPASFISDRRKVLLGYIFKLEKRFYQNSDDFLNFVAKPLGLARWVKTV
jgi:hypothetical protein